MATKVKMMSANQLANYLEEQLKLGNEVKVEVRERHHHHKQRERSPSPVRYFQAPPLPPSPPPQPKVVYRVVNPIPPAAPTVIERPVFIIPQPQPQSSSRPLFVSNNYYPYGSDDYIMSTIGGPGEIGKKHVYIVDSRDKRGAMHLKKGCHNANACVSYDTACAQGRTICQRCKASLTK